MQTLNVSTNSCRKTRTNGVTTAANRVAFDGPRQPSKSVPPLSIGPAIADFRVRKIVQLVESEARFTVQDWAHEFHLTPPYLQRLFRRQTGISMGEWLNEQKLQHAADLLSNSHMSVKEIAYAVGYEHTSSFIRAFERRFTQAPARFRKQASYMKS